MNDNDRDAAQQAHADTTPNPKQLTRDNHYIPQYYLKRWCANSQRIWTYLVLVDHPQVPVWNRYSLRRIAYYENLYTRLMASGETDDVERWFHQDIEQPAERVIDHLIRDRFLAPAEWRTLTRYAVAQSIRTPASFLRNRQRWIATFPAVMEQALRAGVQRLTEAHERGETRPKQHVQEPTQMRVPFPFKLSTAIAPGAAMGTVKGETIVGRSLWLFFMEHVLTTTIAKIGDLSWTILRPPHGVTWLTSDDPVICLQYQDASHYHFQGGWGDPNMEIIVPLGPEHLLYAKVNAPSPPRGTVVTYPQADRLQRMIIAHADRAIFAAHPDPSVPDLRPRSMDKARRHAEQAQWQQWHAEQSAAEQRFFGTPDQR